MNLKVVGAGLVAGAAGSFLVKDDSHGEEFFPPLKTLLVPMGLGAAAGYIVGKRTVGDVLIGGVSGLAGGIGAMMFKPFGGALTHTHVDGGNALCELCVLKERQAILGR